MGRWSQYDEDDYRLPEGMKRIGYDADTQKYTYQDADGSLWEGPEGAEYGSLRQISSPERSEPAYLDIESPARPQRTVQSNENYTHPTHNPISNRARDWRYFGPFLLLVSLVLLLLFRFLNASQASGLDSPCGRYQEVKKGDTCWAIAQEYDLSVGDLVALNKGLECEVLEVGTRLCVEKTEGRDE